MPRRMRASRLLLAIAPCAALGAQIPAHATFLSTQYTLLEPMVLQRGDVVHLFTTTLDTTSLQAFHWRSDDGGRTWPTSQQVLPTPAVPTWLGDVDIALGRTLVLLGDRTAGPLLLRSTDDGSTWAPPIPVAATVFPQAAPVVTDMYVDGQVLVAAWTNDRATGRVFANRSTDGGLTWQPTDAQLDVGAVLPSSTIQRVRCVGVGPVVHVLWCGAVAGQYVTFHQRSMDAGITWRTTPVTVSNSLTGRAATDGPDVILVDSQQGRLLRSADYGDTWVQLNNIGIGNGTDVCNEGSTFVGVGLAGSWTVNPTYVANVSTDGGQTWLANPLALPGPPLLTPRAHFGGGRIWVNFKSGTPYLGALTSADLGLTWQTVGGPVDAGFGASERRTIHVATTPTPNGPREYVYAGAGSTSLGAATAGSGNLAPSLTTVGLPLQGRTTTFQIDGAVGGSIGLLGASPAPPTPWLFGNATIWLGGTPDLVAFTTSGASGAPGAGSFGLPCTVPVSPALIGASLVAQALVLDGGAAAGFTVTNAVEVWLR
jgi:hypothetical protein